MDTWLHKKIKDSCTFTRRGTDHWLLTGPRTIWIPEMHSVVLTRRACYAAFVGDVPDGKDVASGCGVCACISPKHILLQTSSREGSRGLSFPEHLEAFKSSRRSRENRVDQILPKDLTRTTIIKVKELFANGSRLSDVRAITGVSAPLAMKIRHGLLDEAAQNIVRGVRHSPSVISSPEVISPVASGSREKKASSEEEESWLGQVSRG